MHRSRLKLGLFLIALAAIVAFLWPSLRQWRAKVALEAALGPGDQCALHSRSEGRGNDLVEWLNKEFMRHLQYRRYRPEIEALVGGPVDWVVVVNSGPFRGDPGVALARYPRLRRVSIANPGGGAGNATEGQWTTLCTRLRALPLLEELSIEGPSLTDAALAPLAGHPTLRKISLGADLVTPASLAMLASLPNLTELCIYNYGAYTTWRTIELTEAECTRMAQGIRAMARLETLELNGPGITDATIAPLAGHPTLQHMTLFYHHLGLGCTATLSQIPQLKTVTLGHSYEKLPMEQRKMMEAELPMVQFKFQ